MYSNHPKTPKFSAFSASKSSRNASTNRSSIGLFGSSAKKSLQLSRNQSLNRSLGASMIVEETTQHIVKNYGASTPVLILEALSDRYGHVTVKLDSSSEWAWLVSNRQLFVWRYKTTTSGKVIQCKELTLPASDLAHTAYLVTILPNPTDTHITGCIAVSPEGIIRYWPSIGHEGSFVEISADLKGEECASLINMQPYGCVVATTTSTLIQLDPVIGQSSITCRVLNTMQNTLVGIGRRMSSFIFGSNSQQTPGAPLQQIVPGEIIGGARRAFYVLSGSVLQKWTISDTEPERMIYQFEIENHLRSIISQNTASLNCGEVWLLDIQAVRGGIVLLAATNSIEHRFMHYILATVSTDGLVQPDKIKSHFEINHIVLYPEGQETMFLNLRLLIPELDSNTAYLYNSETVMIVSLTNPSLRVDKVEFLPPGDKLLGTGSSDGLALFFSWKHGIVNIRFVSDMSVLEESVLETSKLETSMLNVSSYMEEMTGSNNDPSKVSCLKSAILLTLQGKKAEAQAIVANLFPLSDSADTNSPLASTIVKLSQEMIDDFPATDPRWAEAIPEDSTSSTNSLIILNQLQDKFKAHHHMLTFLHDMNLWNRLGCVISRDCTMRTHHLLSEHAEKIAATIALRNMHATYPRLVDVAIKRVLSKRGETSLPSGLLAQDILYREVSRIEEIFEALFDYEDEILCSSDAILQDQVIAITAINSIIISMLHEAIDYRESKSTCYQCTFLENPPEYIAWTATTGSTGLRTLLRKQYDVIFERGFIETHDVSSRRTLLQQVLDIADIILNGYKQQLESLKPTNKQLEIQNLENTYERERKKLILPLLEMKEYERAVSLAEKYHEFEVLIRVCEETDRQDRLQLYMEQYESQDFAEFAMKWFVEAGKCSKVLKLPISQRAALGRFFDQEENKSISWLYDIDAGNFSQAQTTLKDLALNESRSVAKKKTLLSLSKLAALAADDIPDIHEQIKVINDEHDLLLHQEALPEDVVVALGLNPDNMGVLNAKQLIELYISENNENASEYHFKVALDLLSFLEVDDDEYNSLKLHIWCQSILRDEWSNVAIDNPLENNRHTIFFKTIEMAFEEGMDLKEMLPDVSELLETEELGDLRFNKNFQYLVKAGYEHISSVIN
ncbi:nuclear pore complex protein Nup133-like isoform X2 [Tubulanus polymorphus]|uniref:nuclear pore complex protein Nup133-like isoform X2 n=1 Tax=Tubulanus polymorphus TaxID=672921 RepID=UPI003DA5D942